VPTNKQRREAARRHLERQLERRQEREAVRKRRTLIATVAGTVVLAVVVVIFVVAVTNDNSKKKTTGATPTGTSTAPTSPSATPTTPAAAVTAKYPCVYGKDASGGTVAKKASLPPTKPPKTGKVVVDVKSTQGTMAFTLDRADGPCTVASFESLVKQKYFDNTPCHRLVTSGIYVLQCGDPTGKGTGGPGYTIQDQYTGKEKYTRGVIAMAKTSQPDSGGSQFFIVFKDSLTLPANYTIFGTVTSGMAVIDKVAKAGSNNAGGSGDGAPKLPIKLTQLTVK
jgi:peptidyl-prolyl cis-trans isomerase B (cyclophilin B)